MKVAKELKYLSIVALAVLVVSAGIYIVVNGDKSGTQIAQDLANGIPNYSEGTPDAKVTVVEFFDPECESCAQISPYIKNEIKYYKSQVRWVFRYMAYHPSSVIAIRILEAARKQNLYFDAMTLLFERQHEWGAKHDGTVQGPKERELLNIIAGLPGIDMKRLQEDMKDPAIEKIIENDKKAGTLAGVTGTPTLFVNNKIIDPLSLDMMIQKIDEGLKQ